MVLRIHLLHRPLPLHLLLHGPAMYSCTVGEPYWVSPDTTPKVRPWTIFTSTCTRPPRRRPCGPPLPPAQKNRTAHSQNNRSLAPAALARPLHGDPSASGQRKFPAHHRRGIPDTPEAPEREAPQAIQSPCIGPGNIPWADGGQPSASRKPEDIHGHPGYIPV